MRKFFLGILILVNMLCLGVVFMPHATFAADPALCTKSPTGIEVLPKWYKYLDVSPDGNICNVNAEFPGSIPAILLAVFEILLRISGILAVIFIIYGGFQYLTSTGEPDKAKGARTTIINALVGMMIAMFATVIVNVVGRNIG